MCRQSVLGIVFSNFSFVYLSLSLYRSVLVPSLSVLLVPHILFYAFRQLKFEV